MFANDAIIDINNIRMKLRTINLYMRWLSCFIFFISIHSFSLTQGWRFKKKKKYSTLIMVTSTLQIHSTLLHIADRSIERCMAINV